MAISRLNPPFQGGSNGIQHAIFGINVMFFVLQMDSPSRRQSCRGSNLRASRRFTEINGLQNEDHSKIFEFLLYMNISYFCKFQISFFIKFCICTKTVGLVFRG